MQKNIPIFDLIFYFVFPLLIWHFSRNYIDDYYAMLLSFVPDKGIIIKQIIGWGLSCISIHGFIYISKLLQQQEILAKNVN